MDLGSFHGDSGARIVGCVGGRIGRGAGAQHEREVVTVALYRDVLGSPGAILGMGGRVNGDGGVWGIAVRRWRAGVIDRHGGVLF